MRRRGFGDVVDVVRAMGVRQLLRRVVVDLGEDQGGEGRGLGRGRRRAFREDGGVVRDARAARLLACSLVALDVDRGVLEKWSLCR